MGFLVFFEDDSLGFSRDIFWVDSFGVIILTYLFAFAFFKEF